MIKSAAMRIVLVFALALTLKAGDTISLFGYRWIVDHPADWAIDGGVLRLVTPSEPLPGQPRRPTHFVLADTPSFRRVTVEAEVKRNQRSLIFVYAWQDANHYNYVHISSDTAVKQNVHNGVFHVFGGERVRISPLDGPAALPREEWTSVRMVFDGDTGRVYLEVDGRRNPSLEAVDLSLRHGRVGMGSFDETGDFRNVKITGEAKDSPVAAQQ